MFVVCLPLECKTHEDRVIVILFIAGTQYNLDKYLLISDCWICVAMKLMLYFISVWTSLVVQMVKYLSTMWETWVRALGWEDPLKKEMAIHSSTTAWKIAWTEEPRRLQSMGSQRADTTERLHFHFGSTIISFCSIFLKEI